MSRTQQQLVLAPTQASVVPCDFRSTTLLSHLDQVAGEFPNEVVHRGINRTWHDYQHILKQLSKAVTSSQTLPLDYLDLGAGAGVIPLVMAKTGLRVTAVDTWNEYCKELDNQMGDVGQFFARFGKYGVKSVRHNLLQTPLPFPAQSFDLITLFNVIEHLSKPLDILHEIDRLLRPNGLIFISLPNVANLRNRVRLLLGRTPHADDIETWFSPSFSGHYREMTGEELRRMVSKLGLSIVTAGYSSAWHWNTRLPNGQWDRKYRLNSFHQWAKLFYLLGTVVVPSLRYQVFVAAQKKSPRVSAMFDRKAAQENVLKYVG